VDEMFVPRALKEHIKTVYPTAHDVLWKHQVQIQAAFQSKVDNAVSKTVNLQNTATVKDVEDIYWLAYKTGCKGVTIYRDGSRDRQILDNTKLIMKDGKLPTLEEIVVPRGDSRPENIGGKTVKQETPLGVAYITLNSEKDVPFETFFTLGKGGQDVSSMTEGMGRIISLYLKEGEHGGHANLKNVISQLSNIGGSTTVGVGPNSLKSVSDSLAKGLEKAYNLMVKESGKDVGKKNGGNGMSGELGDECGSIMAFEEGCKKCHNCGKSKC